MRILEAETEAGLSKQELVDACRAYCVLMDLTPIKETPKEEWWLMRALDDCKVPFDQLNDQQRRLIAGYRLSNGGDCD